MKKALLFAPLVGSKVKCQLCAHFCTIPREHTGICRVRKNVRGKLFSLNYDKIAAMHPDPIEKKPLYHFLPGSRSFSIATEGCNFSCRFCQNHSLSIVENERQLFGENKSPEQLIELALGSHSTSIAYTYTEPTVFFELMLETAKLAKENGLKNVMVTNGYMSEQAFDMIQPYLDGANIDLKAFSDFFYKKYCHARLKPVLETIRRMKEGNIWIELTTLLIPDLNTAETEIRQLIDFILSLDDSIPWHVSRFFPHFQLQDTAPTETSVIHQYLNLASQMGIKYAYGGNIMTDRWSNTSCPNCGSLLITRDGYQIRVEQLLDGKCRKCGYSIPGIWA
jgi:pyruvate formate lyase activating enzyme